MQRVYKSVIVGLPGCMRAAMGVSYWQPGEDFGGGGWGMVLGAAASRHKELRK